MSSRYLRMWALISLLMLGAVVELVKFGNPFGSIFDAFPSDLARKEALRRCDQLSTSFSRFFVKDREECYRTMLPAVDKAP
jgi:hypothetical protein